MNPDRSTKLRSSLYANVFMQKSYLFVYLGNATAAPSQQVNA